MNIKNILAVPKAQLSKLTRPYSNRTNQIKIKSDCSCLRCQLHKKQLGIDADSTEAVIDIDTYAKHLYNHSGLATCSKWSAEPFSDSSIPGKLKDWTRRQMCMYLVLLMLCDKHNGILMDIDLDDLIEATGYDIATIRSSLKLLHEQGLIYQNIHSKDRKFVDIILWGYEDAFKQGGSGYLAITSEEYQSILSAKTGLGAKIALTSIETTDAGRGNATAYTHTIRERTLPYVRDYQVRDSLTKGKDSSLLQNLFGCKAEKKEIKPKHKKTQTKYKFTFSRAIRIQDFHSQLVKEMKQRILGTLTNIAAKLNEVLGIEAANKLIDRFSSKNQIEKIANLALSYNPDLIIETLEQVVQRKNNISDPASYIGRLCANGIYDY